MEFNNGSFFVGEDGEPIFVDGFENGESTDSIRSKLSNAAAHAYSAVSRAVKTVEATAGPVISDLAQKAAPFAHDAAEKAKPAVDSVKEAVRPIAKKGAEKALPILKDVGERLVSYVGSKLDDTIEADAEEKD